MKVVIIGSEPTDYTIAFANSIATKIPIALVVPKDRFASLVSAFNPSINLHLLDWPRHRSLRNPAFLWRLTRLIRRERPDLVHLLSNTALWLNLALPFWRPIPLLTTVHDITVHPGDRDTAKLPGWSSRLVVRQSSDIVVHGESLRKRAAGAFDKSTDRIHVLPHPAMPRYADLACCNGMDRQTPKQCFNVLMFGRIYAYKGLDTLIKAEALIGEHLRGLRIVVAGRGDNPRDLTDMMGQPQRYDIRHRFIEDDETAQLFVDADLVVLPYREASQSGVLPVAVCFGKPVIVTDVGELRDTVEPNGLGLVVSPNSPKELASAIQRMAEDKALRTNCGANALRWATSVVSADQVGRQTVDLYKRIARKA